VQGMSYVAANLLLHIGEEYLAFEAFANLMHKYLLFTFYSFDMPKVNIDFNLFMRLMKTHVPKLHGPFLQLGISCSFFMFEWVVAMFCNILPLSFSARVWDSWLFHGEVFFYKVCLGVCQLLLDNCGSQGGEDMLVVMFKSIDKYVTEDALFAKMDSIKLTEKEYAKLRDEFEANAANLEQLVS
jgi:hypothetical protein